MAQSSGIHSARRAGINFISGGAGYLFPMVISLWSTPYVLKELGQEAFGIQVLANVIIGYFMAVDMGLDIPITKKIAENNAANLFLTQSNFLRATSKIYFFIGLVGCLLILMSSNFLISWLNISESVIDEGKIVFYLSGLGFLGSVVNMWGKAVFNGLHRYDISNGVNVASSTISILLGLFLIHLGFGVVGFFAARVSGFLLSSTIYISLASKRIVRFSFRPYFEKQAWLSIKSQIGYGSMLRISGLVFSRIDQTLIAGWLSIASVTVYSFPILIVTTLSGLIASSTHFVFPTASAMVARNSADELKTFFLQMAKSITILCTIVFIPFIAWGDKFIGLWISPEVALGSKNVMLVLGVSFYITSILTIGANAFLAGMGHLKLVTISNLVKSIFLLCGFLIAIKPFGLDGAAYVYLFANIIDLLSVTWVLNRVLKLDFSYLFVRAYLKPVATAIVASFILYFLRDFTDTWTQIIISTTIYVCLMATFAFQILLNEWEKQKVLGFLKLRLNT